MIHFRLVIEYCGTRYHGWQRQLDLPTLQAVLEEQIEKVSTHKTAVTGAGRTDAGVHALHQAAHFTTHSRLTAQKWKAALNALLPPDIVVLDVRRVSKDFHARRSALGKTYQYRILNRRTPSAFLEPFTWHIPIPLRLSSMQKAARDLVGVHDFTSFCVRSALKGKNPLVKLSRVSVRKKADILLITITGTHFLQYMVRNITGTLVQVGLGRIPSSKMNEILLARNRNAAGPTAPARGLFLVKVRY